MFTLGKVVAPSLRANGSRECAPDDRLREAIHGAANAASEEWIASSHPPSPEGGLRRTGVLLAMTLRHNCAISLNTVIASGAKQSMAPQAKRWIASSQGLLAMTAGHRSAISPARAPRGLLLFPALSELRAQGMPGARCAR
jgi:hypothetical protein